MKLFGNFFSQKNEKPEEQTGEQNNIIDMAERRKEKQKRDEVIFRPSASEIAEKILEKDRTLKEEQMLAEEKEKAEALERKE